MDQIETNGTLLAGKEMNSGPDMIISAILLSLLTIWTAIGNIVVIIAIVRFKRLQSNSNYLIANLALSDFFLAITVLPFSATTDITENWLFGKIFCPTWLIIDILLCTASVWNLVVIAVDRYTATTFPVWYRSKRKKLFTLIYILTVWVGAIIISLPGLFLSGIISTNGNEVYIVKSDEEKIYECRLFDSQTYVFYSALGSFIVPLVLMIILYAKIFSVLNRRSKDLRARQKIKMNALIYSQNSSSASNGANSPEQLEIPINEASSNKETGGNKKKTACTLNQEKDNERVDRRERRATKQMGFIIFIFVMCWIPFTIMYMIRSFCGVTTSEKWRQFITWLGYANSGMNPIILIIFNVDMRLAFKNILTCGRMGQNLK